MKFRHQYDAPLRVVTDLSNELDSTDQSFKTECDINNIVANYLKGNPVPLNQRLAQYGEFADFPDFHQAQETLLQAETMFLELPAKMRARFNHDPGQLLDFLQDENNRTEAEQLGLINPRPPPATPPAPAPEKENNP